MAFLQDDTLKIDAKLTRLGKKLLINSDCNLIKYFSLSDNDANYFVDEPLGFNQVPTITGDFDYNHSGSISDEIQLRKPIMVSTGIEIFKSVNSISNNVIETTGDSNYFSLGPNDLTVTLLSTKDHSNPLNNLLNTFGLPYYVEEIEKYSTPVPKRGYLNTFIDGFVSDEYLVFNINADSYGELIDGRSIRLLMNEVEVYSSYSSLNNNPDSWETEFHPYAQIFGDNIVFLFSDYELKPQDGKHNSWAEGYRQKKAFASGNKPVFIQQSNATLGLSADKSVGFAVLDKGFIVITSKKIIDYYKNSIEKNDYVSTFAPVIGCNLDFTDINNMVYQNIIFSADANEFYTSQNKSFDQKTDDVRISEIGLYDEDKNLIALCKLNKHLVKKMGEKINFSIKLSF